MLNKILGSSLMLYTVVGGALFGRGAGPLAQAGLADVPRMGDKATYRNVITADASKAGTESRPPSIRVEADKPGVRVSPLLYGIFFEEINRAGDGGLYAEMLQNRSFEDAAVPLGWSAVQGDGKMALDTSQPLNANNPTSLRLEGRIRVANNGFKGAPYKRDEDPAKWLPAFETNVQKMAGGVAVKEGQAYQLFLYARGQGPVTVTLEKQDGTVLAQHEVSGIGSEWKKFDAVLSTGATDANARLVVASAATVWLDMVSLMPKGGLFRADLLKLLAEMKPAFLRFPGGCWVEGDTMSFAYRWKKTIGDVAERPGLWCRWGYYSNDGLGFHEYLLLCEALKAEPLFVINCGMAHHDHVPLDRLGEYVQEALDAIEYANGPADSRWGALRAKAGHSEPFNLKMLQIGNENGGKLYDERYAAFYDAIKARYPEINLVACKWPGIPTSRPVEILDEHYYRTPQFFMREADHYDRYARDAYKVYCGEYAVTQGCGMGNLIGALGEAAFMTGMERNGDVVAMASYAPLLVYPEWRRWNPNAIVFDAARAYGTPSYHLQALFANHRADVVLPVAVEAPPAKGSATAGIIGVGTYNTQAEFKDIQVLQDGKTLYAWEAARGLKGWRTQGGQWAVRDGALCQTGTGERVRALLQQKFAADYTLTLKGRKTGGAEGFMIFFENDGFKDRTWWNLGGRGNRQHALQGPDMKVEYVRGRIETGRWYDIRIEVKGGRVTCYLDGQQIHQIDYMPISSLYATAGFSGDKEELILKVVNVSTQPVEAQVSLKGLGRVGAKARCWVMAGQDDDENSFEQPCKVAPQEGVVTGVGPEFPHVFPAKSVSVLRVPAAK